MYSIKKERYYFYEFGTFNFELKRIFSNYNELIYFLAYAQVDKLQISRKEKIYHNKYLDEINLTLNDLKCFLTYKNEYVSYIRPFLFLDENNSIIDVRNFYEDIIYVRNQIDEKRKKYDKRRPLPGGYVFRKTPIPYTGKNRSGWTRDVKYGHIIKDLKNPENKDYVKKNKYRDLLEPYCDLPYKRTTKSWKEQCKKRHQWQKHEK